MTRNRVHSPSIAYHDALANDWDERYLSGSFLKRFKFIRSCILADITANGHWLDAGCGTGKFSRLIADKGVKVTGVDGSAAMILNAEKIAAKHPAKDNLTFSKIDSVEKLPFTSGHFDGCILFSVLEYVPDPAGAIAEVARVLMPGASCAVSVPHNRSAVRAAQKLHLRLSRPSSKSSISYLDSSHFSLSACEARKFFPAAGLSVKFSVGFDPFIPAGLFWPFAPSPLYHLN